MFRWKMFQNFKKEKVFLDFVNTLKEENYVVNYDVVNVADYGVPQRRETSDFVGVKEKRNKDSNTDA